MNIGFYDTFKIREYMIKNKLSKSEFCKKCSISIYAYNKILKQDINVNIDALFRIAREMNIQIKDLFF